MRRQFYYLVVLYALSFKVVVADEYECYKEIFTVQDTLNIILVSTSYCDCLEAVPGDGFVLYSSNYVHNELNVLWGKTTIDNSKNKYFLANIDDDKISELLTLYLDESNIWGYVHRFTVDTNYQVTLQTLELPFMIIVDDKPIDKLLRINSDKSITILGKTYESANNLTVYYDEKNDSLSLKETDPM